MHNVTPRLSVLNVSEPHPALHSFYHVLLILFCTAVRGIFVELLINGAINNFFPFSLATVGKGRFYFFKTIVRFWLSWLVSWVTHQELHMSRTI